MLLVRASRRRDQPISLCRLGQAIGPVRSGWLSRVYHQPSSCPSRGLHLVRDVYRSDAQARLWLLLFLCYIVGQRLSACRSDRLRRPGQNKCRCYSEALCRTSHLVFAFSWTVPLAVQSLKVGQADPSRKLSPFNSHSYHTDHPFGDELPAVLRAAQRLLNSR